MNLLACTGNSHCYPLRLLPLLGTSANLRSGTCNISQTLVIHTSSVFWASSKSVWRMFRLLQLNREQVLSIRFQFSFIAWNVLLLRRLWQRLFLLCVPFCVTIMISISLTRIRSYIILSSRFHLSIRARACLTVPRRYDTLYAFALSCQYPIPPYLPQQLLIQNTLHSSLRCHRIRDMQNWPPICGRWSLRWTTLTLPFALPVKPGIQYPRPKPR